VEKMQKKMEKYSEKGKGEDKEEDLESESESSMTDAQTLELAQFMGDKGMLPWWLDKDKQPALEEQICAPWKKEMRAQLGGALPVILDAVAGKPLLFPGSAGATGNGLVPQPRGGYAAKPEPGAASVLPPNPPFHPGGRPVGSQHLLLSGSVTGVRTGSWDRGEDAFYPPGLGAPLASPPPPARAARRKGAKHSPFFSNSRKRRSKAKSEPGEDERRLRELEAALDAKRREEGVAG
jgi:hypothetical protein